MKLQSRRAVLLILLIVSIGVRLWPQTAAGRIAPGLYAELQTNKGVIVLRLEFEKTPLTVANFVGLAEGTIANKALPLGRPYFDGSVFHRVVPGHVIQAGKPGGTSFDGPGYEIPNEIVPGLGHGRAGMLGMANSGPHTAGSQFYITLGDRSYLDGDYTVFGEVESGFDVVNSIVQGDVVEKVTILRIGAAAQSFKTDNSAFERLVNETRARVEKLEQEKKVRETNLINERWPKAAALKPGLAFQVERRGTGKPAAAGAEITVRYSGETLEGKRFVSGSDGKPGFGDTPEPFAFAVGTTTIVPGIDAVLALMKRGEKRLVILAPEFGYSRSGFYSKPEPGKKRFVISPNTTLVYEVEIDPGK